MVSLSRSTIQYVLSSSAAEMVNGVDTTFSQWTVRLVHYSLFLVLRGETFHLSTNHHFACNGIPRL
jgi:hypothetical protein